MTPPEPARGSGPPSPAQPPSPAHDRHVRQQEFTPPSRVAILGVGLLGGSFGLAVRRCFPASTIVGVSRSGRSRAAALERGAIQEATDDPHEACRDADVVVVATPVDRIAELVIATAADSRPDALVTDLGSTKRSLVAAIETNSLASQKFVGAHPIAGGEKTGAEHAREDLFRDRVVVLTPTAGTDPERVARARRLWELLGASVLVMSPSEHDERVARISHVPHLVASMLANLTPAEARPLIGSGWLDTTRVASGDPEMWAAICEANQQAIVDGLADALSELTAFREVIASGNRSELIRLLDSAKRRRDEWLTPPTDP